MAIIWDQPQQPAPAPVTEETIEEAVKLEQLIEEAEEDDAVSEILQEIEAEQAKSPFRGFGY